MIHIEREVEGALEQLLQEVKQLIQLNIYLVHIIM